MTVRFYIIPIERTASLTRRGPKYFKWPSDPNPPGINCAYMGMDYGDVDIMLICADILDADHTALIANADVLSLPLNLDQTLTAGAVNIAQTFLENQNIPAGWINTTLTYRQVLRVIGGMFQFMQRVFFFFGQSFNLPAGWTNLTVSQLSVQMRNALSQAATSFGYDTSAITGATTMRQILKVMADNWGQNPLDFGLASI